MKIIKFNAVWCPACLVQRTIWKSLKDEIKDINVTEYDYDLDEDMVLKYEVGKKLPVVIILDDNDKEVKRLIGEKSKKEIIEFLGIW